MMGKLRKVETGLKNPKNTYSWDIISQQQYGTFTQLKSKIDPV